MKKSVLPFPFLAHFLFVACASIVGDKTQLVPIGSTPDEANVLIRDETGKIVFKGQTPTSVTLEKSDGSYWGGKTYQVIISKERYGSQTVTIKASPNGWYLAGNFVFGGLIGWFIVDPLNGAMYTLSPKEVNSNLSATSTYDESQKRIFVVLLENVPEHLRSKMKRIN